MKCPRCGEDAKKVIYLGAPMKLCSDEGCNCLWGFWSWVPELWSDGCFAFMQYEGWYLPALWHWLFGSDEE